VGTARKVVVVIGALGMTMMIPAIYVSSLVAIAACIAVATFCYAALSTMVLNLPADLYPTRSVASVSGLGGTAAGIGTILASYGTGVVADRYSFEPILIAASIVPLIAMVAVLVLVRNNEATRRGVVSGI
jgi:ACS family hexuronate transporter-like MFS transporter